MTFEERKKIKEKMNNLRKVYNDLTKELSIVPKDSQEEYEIRCQLSMLGEEIRTIRKVLFDDKFCKFYFSTIFNKIVFGDEEENVAIRK